MCINIDSTALALFQTPTSDMDFHHPFTWQGIKCIAHVFATGHLSALTTDVTDGRVSAASC